MNDPFILFCTSPAVESFSSKKKTFNQTKNVFFLYALKIEGHLIFSWIGDVYVAQWKI